MHAQTPPVVTLDLLQRIAPSEKLLRTIQAGGWADLGELAEQADRPRSNLTRDLGRLEVAGLVEHTAGKDKPALTAEAVAGLAAADRVANPVREGEAAQVSDHAQDRVHADFTPNPNQPRKRFNPEAVSQRRASIVRDGLLQNLLARPNPDQTSGATALEIVSGETRWRAIGEAIELGELPADFPIKTDVRDLTDEQVLSIGLVENMQRSDLTPLEEARGFAKLIEKFGRTTAEIAETVSKTQRFVQLRLSLLNLTDEEQAQLESEELNFTEALRILANRPKPLELSPAEALCLAEVAAAAAGDRPAAYHHKAECAADAAQSPVVAGLITRDLLVIEGPDHFTGGFVARFADYVAFDKFAQQFRAVIPADRSSGLLSVRAAVLGADEAERLDSEGLFSHGWLNGPFELTEEGKAILEQRRQEQAQNAVRAAESDAERALRMRRLSEADARSTDLLKGLAKPRVGAEIAGFAEVLDAAEAPLPWSIGRHDGWTKILDATGKPVDFPAYASDAASIRLKLVMAAVNAAAGLAPMVAEPTVEPEAEDDEEADEAEPEEDPA